MFRNIFLKTLFEKRWVVLWWALSSTSLVIFVVIFFPTLKDSFGQALTNVPESLRKLIGDASDYRTLNGYLNVQVFQQMIFLIVTFGVILCTGLLAGEESDGTLQSLLSLPVSRGKVYLHKLAASAAIIGIVAFSFFAGSMVGALIINEHVDAWRLFQATLMTWLVTLAISYIAFALAAITGKRGISGSIAGVYAFTMYVITSMVVSVKSLRIVEYFSPFHYFNNPSPLKAGFYFGNMLVLLAASIILAIIGYCVFIKRDIYQR